MKEIHLKIKEVIVVEGRDDVTAVKRAVDAELIITQGFGIREETFELIEEAQKKMWRNHFYRPRLRRRKNS